MGADFCAARLGALEFERIVGVVPPLRRPLDQRRAYPNLGIIDLSLARLPARCHVLPAVRAGCAGDKSEGVCLLHVTESTNRYQR